MAYTREMFLRDNYPKDYEKFLLVNNTFANFKNEVKAVDTVIITY